MQNNQYHSRRHSRKKRRDDRKTVIIGEKERLQVYAMEGTEEPPEEGSNTDQEEADAAADAERVMRSMKKK